MKSKNRYEQKPWDGMNTDGIVKYGNREMTMFSKGDIFCSLSKEDLEKEREAAMESRQKFHDLLLLEESSNMTLEDFIQKQKEWEDEKYGDDDYKRKSLKHKLDWEDYRYHKETYDRERVTELKLKRWKKLTMIQEHAAIPIYIILGLYAMSVNNMWVGIFAFGIAMVAAIGVGVKWYHKYTERDIPETVGV